MRIKLSNHLKLIFVLVISVLVSCIIYSTGLAMGSGGGGGNNGSPDSAGRDFSSAYLTYTSDFTVTEQLNELPGIGQVLSYTIQNSSTSYIWGFGVGVIVPDGVDITNLSITTTPNPDWDNFPWNERVGWLSTIIPSDELYDAIIEEYSAIGYNVPDGLRGDLSALYDGYDYIYISGFDFSSSNMRFFTPIAPGDYDDSFRIIINGGELVMGSPVIYITTPGYQPPSSNNLPNWRYNYSNHSPNSPQNNPVVPEPISLVLFGIGLIGGLFSRRRKAN